MKYLMCLTAFFVMSGCVTKLTPQEAPDQPTIGEDYKGAIQSHTKFQRHYDGFYEVFRGHATMFTPECREAILKQEAIYLKWDSRKMQAERDRANSDMATKTQFFLQLFTPDVEYNDLGKYNSIWKVYLEVDGHRFEGKPKKVHGKPIEFESLYPEYDRFSRPYQIDFNISTADVIRHEAKLILTSTLGTAEFIYPPSK